MAIQYPRQRAFLSMALSTQARALRPLQRSLPSTTEGAVVRRHVIPLTFPELALIAGTRGMLGAGIALVLADRLDAAQRRAVGRTLLLIGAISTIPLLMRVLHKRR
jgi:hypothetical protein